MRNSKETDFPPPPPNRNGWPWTETSPQLPDTMPDRSPWPRISIVTPSYNQGQLIEETIRSVLLQGYPNLEYIIMDGGSADNSVEIIRKYEPWLTYWVSEPDGGQADAINKGWKRATGAYITWLNSDDLLKPQALERSVGVLVNEKLDLVYGDIALIDVDSSVIGTYVGHPFSLEQMIRYMRDPVPQPGFLMRQTMLQEVGYLDDSLHCAMDFDYWIRLALWGASARSLPNELAAFRMHVETKTFTMHLDWIKDYCQICEKVYGGELSVEAASWEREARAIVALMCANRADQAGDNVLMRRYAWKHIGLMRSRSLFIAWKVFLLSFLGDYARTTLQRIAAACRRAWRICAH